MKKSISILTVIVAFFVFGCNNGLSKADVQKMINESKQNTSASGGSTGGTTPSTPGGTTPSTPGGTTPTTPGGSSISEIFETALNEVCGKTWKSTRNTAPAAGKGGWTEAGFDHEIFFDKKNFNFSVSLADNGVKGEGEAKLNKDYAQYVDMEVAELKDGKLTFKNRLYIRRVYLPKLTKWLSYNQHEDKDGNGTWNDVTDPVTDDPFEEYFIEGFHAGLPNILIDCEVEIQTTGVDRFKRSAVDNLALIRPLRLVIKNGNLTMPSKKTNMEDPAGGSLDRSNMLNRLMDSYYADIDNTFTADFEAPKKDIGTFDATPTDLRALLTSVKALCNDANKRTLKTDASSYTWGYRLSGALATADINNVFHPNKIHAVKAVEIDNPAYDDKQPEDPITNPKKIYSMPLWPALHTPDYQLPENIDKANPGWISGDSLKTATLSHQINGINAYAVKDFDKLAATSVTYDILYGDDNAINPDFAPAKLTIKRLRKEVKGWEDAADVEKDYVSNTVADGKDKTADDFDYDKVANWKKQKHKGQMYQYRETYTLTLEFEDAASAAMTYALGNDKHFVGKKYECTYEAVKTGSGDDTLESVYKIDSYEVYENYKKEDKWLRFNNIVLYGKIIEKQGDGSWKDPNGGNSVVLNGFFKDNIDGGNILCDTVLNTQTQFFIPATTSNVIITEITGVEIIPEHENVAYNLRLTKGTFKSSGTGIENWQARLNKDDQETIDTNDVTGKKTFEINNLNTMQKIAGAELIISLSGLSKNSNPKRAGKDRSPSNLREDWHGYSFVIHFGR